MKPAYFTFDIVTSYHQAVRHLATEAIRFFLLIFFFLIFDFFDFLWTFIETCFRCSSWPFLFLGLRLILFLRFWDLGPFMLPGFGACAILSLIWRKFICTLMFFFLIHMLTLVLD